jgi:hypothetical protein
MSVGQLILLFVGIIIGIYLFVASANIIADSCAP